jgi:putative hydrolase of the HAD superfamily
MMQVKAVLFDLFDTLLLLEEGDAFYTPSLKRLHGFLTENAINVSFDDFEQVYFEVRDEHYERVQKNLEEPHFRVRVSGTLQRLGHDFEESHPIVAGAVNAFADEFMHYVSLDNDALDVLQKLRRRFKLGIVSNFGIPECAWQLLDQFGLRELFEVVLISAEVNIRKPSPKIFDMPLRLLGLEASEAIFVGDTPGPDVEGPRNVGMEAVLIERRPLRRISDAEPDKVIRRLRDLLDVLDVC